MNARARAAGAAAIVSGSLMLSAGAEETADQHRGTFAKPVERPAPAYPGSQLRRGKQGWVQLSFVVTADGRVVDPIIADSSGIREFEREALRTVENWSYEPATWDGEPVQQCQNEVMVSFAVEGAEGISRNFYSLYRKIDKALVANEVGKARKLLEQARERALSTWEYAAYQLLEARYADLDGDPETRLRHLRRAAMSDGKWLSEDMYASVLYAIVVTEIQLEKYSAALETWQKLAEANGGRYDLAEVENAIARLREFVDGPSVIAVEGTLETALGCQDCPADWHYRPLRRSFSLDDVEGEIEELEIRCDWQRVVAAGAEDKIWSIPEAWGSCKVIVQGAPGTTFAYLEQPGGP